MKPGGAREYLMDTSSWIEFYKKTIVGKKIQQATKDSKKYTPTAVIGELRNIIRDESFFKIKAMVLQESETIHCNDNISEYAGQLRKDRPNKRISWVDYIIVATAKVNELTICSTDHHFDFFKNIINVKVWDK